MSITIFNSKILDSYSSVLWILSGYYMYVFLNSDRNKGKKNKLEMTTGSKRNIHLKTEWKWNGLSWQAKISYCSK